MRRSALLLEGDLLGGKYRIGERIGEGGMAQVFRAWDTRLERAVAVKVVDPRVTVVSRVRERFLREARAMARVESPFLPEIYDVDEDDGHLYLVLGLLEGQSMEEMLGERLEPVRSVRLVCDILGGLEALHLAGLVHRDVKPSNIYVQHNGRAVLLDLGIVYELGGTSLTSKGMVLGTPEYMSPEHAQGYPVDVRTDLYAAALVAVYAMTGESGGIESPSSIHRRVESDQWLDALLPDVPESLRPVLRRALDRAPERRYQSASSMCIALLAHLACPTRNRDEPGRVRTQVARMPRLSPQTEDIRGRRHASGDDEH